MAQKVLLVNEYDTRQRFELTYNEAHDLIEAKAVFFCLADTVALEEKVGYAFIAVHAAVDTRDAYSQFVEVIESVRKDPTKSAGYDDVNPMTGRRMNILTLPKSPPDLN